MPPFDIRGARGRGNPHPRRRRRPIPTKLYTPLTGAGRRSTPRRVVTRNHRAVVTKQAYRPNPKRVISHRRVKALQQRAEARKNRQLFIQGRKSKIPGVRETATAVVFDRNDRRARANPKWRKSILSADRRKTAGAIPGVFPVAKAKYRAYTRDLWDRASQYYPSPDMPVTRVLTPVREGQTGNIMAFTRRRTNDVSVTPGVALAYLLRQPGHAEFAESVPLHEWAHAFQRDKARRPQWDVEGGAEAFEQDIARKLRLSSQTNKVYKRYVRKVRRRRSRKYIRRGQFR